MASHDLADLVGTFRDELEGSLSDAPPEAASRLYDVLIEPVASRVAGSTTVVFIPDGSLHAVAFSALANAKTGRFLVEDHSIVVAPSIALFVRASERRDSDEAPGAATLLAVGDPAFDAAAFPYLPRLAGAANESKRVAKLYSEAVVLTGEAATRRSFLAEIGRHTVIHIAGHALTNDADPLRSRFLFAPDPEHGDSGMLFAEDLYGTPFGRTRLDVLAACSTASGRISRGEGPLSLARPFLAGGVPAVLATLWEIEDAPSSELLIGFHRQVASGRPPQEALREAQVSFIQGSDPALRSPRVWAAFQLAGGVTRSIRG
jgi:CHAT domain-containing protein